MKNMVLAYTDTSLYKLQAIVVKVIFNRLLSMLAQFLLNVT